MPEPGMPMPSKEQAYWDHVGDDWRRKQPQALWREFTDRHQLELVDQWLGRGRHESFAQAERPRLLKTDLFDEVAGRGLVHDLAARGWAVTGIDVSPLIVEEATARNPRLEAIPADVRSLPFPDGHFDAIFSSSTLDHFESVADIDVALRELARMVRPGGSLILTLDNPENPLIWLRNGRLSRILRRLGIVPYQIGETLHRRSLTDALQAAGFEILQMTATMHCPRVLAVALAAPFNRLGGRSRAAFLRGLGAFEVLERVPTRWITGHYLAVHALRTVAAGD